MLGPKGLPGPIRYHRTMGDSSGADDLGHGVVARPDADGTWIVASSRLDLDWRPRQGRVPGTAVALNGELLEVVEAVGGTAAHHYRLAPWPEGEAARVVDRLDPARVAELAATSASERAQRARRHTLVAILPLAGFLPGPTQQRLERECNFPAARATAMSALFELAAGAFLVVQLAAARFGEGLLPPALSWLGMLSALFVPESLVRLWWSLTQGAPMGSLLTLPLALLEPLPPPRDPLADYRPRPVSLDPEAGVLELATDRNRPDWVEDGVLQYRERRYRLVEKLPRRGSMVYRLERVADDTPLTLQLPPSRKPTPRGHVSGEPGPLGLTLRIMLMSFAPRAYQERWFRSRGTSPVVPTVLCALVEAFGGAVNLVGRPSEGPVRLLDLYFLAEGLVRLALVLGRGRAVGSIFGLPFLPLYRRWTGTKP